MSKEQVMDYVMNSPANTNPNVLSGMLDSIADASSGGAVEVERIFIADVNGSWTSVAGNAVSVFSGGTGFAESVADKIGGKTIIGFGIGAENEKKEGAIISLRVIDGNDQPLLGTKGENVYGLGVYALKNGGAGATPLAIYAICI